MDELIDLGLVVQSKPGSVPHRKYYLDEGRGVPIQSLWDDIPNLQASSKERVGYPTQKPLLLYQRMIQASSNEGDIVCDPFAGCATTLVAAEKMQRQWVGMDIWEGAHRLVIERLQDAAGLFGDVVLTTNPPIRTDDGAEAAPFLRVRVRVKEPEGPRWTRAEMYDFLLTQHGLRCQGCDRTFDDSRYLELDHNTPRSDGGLNHISNRILLCGPCNRLKSNTYTRVGLRRENKKRGYIDERGTPQVQAPEAPDNHAPISELPTTKGESGERAELPGASLKRVRSAFFRPVKVRREPTN